MSRLTDKQYWESTYTAERESAIALDDWRTYTDTQIFRCVAPLVEGSGAVIEVGAGDSMWLPFLALRYSRTTFAGLDYAESGCARLAARLAREGAQAAVILGDLFSPPDDLLAAADLALSFGVVEHFDRLDEPLAAISALVRPGGHLFTLIPNMAGVLGKLTQRWNERVYRLHVPHDLDSFRTGHRVAGLTVKEIGYLGSSNFGVLSSCFEGPHSQGFSVYRQLSRLSKAAWFVESRGLPLPSTPFLAPYLYCVSQRPK